MPDVVVGVSLVMPSDYLCQVSKVHPCTGTEALHRPYGQ